MGGGGAVCLWEIKENGRGVRRGGVGFRTGKGACSLQLRGGSIAYEVVFGHKFDFIADMDTEKYKF